MKLYQVEVKAYQIIEVEAENDEKAKILAIQEGIDLGCSEWETNIISECDLETKEVEE